MDAPRPAAPRTRRPVWMWWFVGALAVVLAAGGGFFAWRTINDQTGPATVAAQRAVDALTNHTIGDGAFAATVGPNEIDDLAATLRGMGTLKPVVTVQNVQLDF